MFMKKKYIKYLVMTIVVIVIFAVVFTIGITKNPEFSVYDLFLNITAELVGMVIALVLVEDYLNLKKEIILELAQSKYDKAAANKIQDSFEVINGEGFDVVECVSTLRDKHTGVRYLLVIHEHGSGLTPLLDKDGKPMVDERTE